MENSDTLGPYKIYHTLGSGTYSKVKLALHEPTGKQYAIKIH